MKSYRAVVLLGLLAAAVGRPRGGDPLSGALRALAEPHLAALERLLDRLHPHPPQDPEDLMMADAPLLEPTDLTDTNTTDTDLRRDRESWELLGGRKKELRINSIKQRILSIVGREDGNGSLPNQKHDFVSFITKVPPPWSHGDVYTEKVQSFYPSCETPRNTDEDLWNKGDTMNLHFVMNMPDPPQGSIVNIVSAKLRLFKISQGNLTGSNEACQPELEDVLRKPPPPGLPMDDKQIRVSVYWYTRSLKKHRVKRKLLDSQMIWLRSTSWTEWNIRPAVRSWRETGKNFGITVEVEDEDGVILPATKFFSPMNCSKEVSTSRPIPGFVVKVARAMAGNDSQKFGLDPLLVSLPMMDLCTVEVPESEASSHSLYHNSPQYDFPDSEHHRVRHHHDSMNHRGDDSMEHIPWEDGTDGSKHLLIAPRNERQPHFR